MTTSITVPKSNVPVGRVKINDQVFDVEQHPEFVRFYYDLFRRAGGSAALTNIELADGTTSLDSDAQMLRSDLSAMEALRAIDELRNEFASIRSACDELRSQLSDVEAQFAGARAILDLRSRVEQLEDRLP